MTRGTPSDRTYKSGWNSYSTFFSWCAGMRQVLNWLASFTWKMPFITILFIICWYWLICWRAWAWWRYPCVNISRCIPCNRKTKRVTQMYILNFLMQTFVRPHVLTIIFDGWFAIMIWNISSFPFWLVYCVIVNGSQTMVPFPQYIIVKIKMNRLGITLEYPFT